MSPDALLTGGFILWSFITLAIYIGYRLDSQAQRLAWRRIAEERRRLWAARQLLDDMNAQQRFPHAKSQLDDYLADD